MAERFISAVTEGRLGTESETETTVNRMSQEKQEHSPDIGTPISDYNPVESVAKVASLSGNANLVTVGKPEKEQVPKLKVVKPRDSSTKERESTTKEKDPTVVDFSKLNSYRRISSTISVTKVTNEKSDEQKKIDEMTREMKELTHNITKIRKELDVVDDLIPDTYEGSTIAKSMDYKKLKFAREKLYDKYETLKKEHYELEIKLNNKLKHVYGYNGADRAQYFASNVVNM